MKMKRNFRKPRTPARVAGVFKNLREGKETGTSAKYKEQREGVRQVHPLPTSPLFFAHSRRAPSLARFLARLFDLRPGKGKKTASTQATRNQRARF